MWGVGGACEGFAKGGDGRVSAGSSVSVVVVVGLEGFVV